MKRRTCRNIILMATLLVTCWVSATSKPLPRGAANQQGHVDQKPIMQEDVPGLFSGFTQTQQLKGGERLMKSYEERLRSLSMVGSTPPRCEHKCRSCIPCDPIQIPATTGRVGVMQANYEPEGWKCKCGTSYFNP